MISKAGNSIPTRITRAHRHRCRVAVYLRAPLPGVHGRIDLGKAPRQRQRRVSPRNRHGNGRSSSEAKPSGLSKNSPDKARSATPPPSCWQKPLEARQRHSGGHGSGAKKMCSPSQGNGGGGRAPHCYFSKRIVSPRRLLPKGQTRKRQPKNHRETRVLATAAALFEPTCDLPRQCSRPQAKIKRINAKRH